MFLLFRTIIHRIKQQIKYYISVKYFISFNDRNKLSIFANAINEEFVFINSSKKSKVLIEGHFSNSGINYLFRLILLSKTIQEISESEFYVFFNGPKSNFWRKSIYLYKKVGVNNFIYNEWDYKKHKTHLIHMLSNSLWNQINTPEDIINLKIEGVLVGDLIYDDILKKENISTVEVIKLDYKKYLDIACKLYFDYDKLFNDNNYTFYLSTHTTYVEYGLLCRIALKYNVNVIETTDIHTAIFNSNDILPTYHQGFRNAILKKKEYYDNEKAAKIKLVTHYINHLTSRLNNQLNQIDVKLAYGDKLVYTRDSLSTYFKVDSSKKNIFIVAHVFKDSPHISDSMLFNDYYDWLIKTLLYLKDFSLDYNCFVKSHPSADLYGEKNLIKDLLKKNRITNIFLLNDDFSPKSFINCADVILTCQGTVGIEYTCFGIPVVTSGDAFYANLGYTIDPKSIKEYYSVLSNLVNISKLDEQQIQLAQYIYALYNEFITSENKLITTEVLQLIWGYNVKPDHNKAFDLLLNNILNNGVKSHPLYNKTKEIFLINNFS